MMYLGPRGFICALLLTSVFLGVGVLFGVFGALGNYVDPPSRVDRSDPQVLVGGVKLVYHFEYDTIQVSRVEGSLVNENEFPVLVEIVQYRHHIPVVTCWAKVIGGNINGLPLTVKFRNEERSSLEFGFII